jgi:hypothetical protein
MISVQFKPAVPAFTQPQPRMCWIGSNDPASEPHEIPKGAIVVQDSCRECHVLTGRIVAHVREQRAQRRWLDRRAR